MNKDNALVPAEQRDVLFYDDEIIAVRLVDGRVMVPVRPMAELLGLDWSGQSRRLRNDPVLQEETEDVQVATAGGPQTMPCLPLDMINGWLFGINANRVGESVRPRLIRYQRECYRVLAAAFREVPHPGERSGRAALVEVEQLGYALIQLAREQMEFDDRLGVQEERIDNVVERVTALEAHDQDEDEDVVSEEQASQISQAVKAIAMTLSNRTGRNEYGGVYGELYRRFGVTSYKRIPASRFREAMNWLDDWHAQLHTDSF